MKKVAGVVLLAVVLGLGMRGMGYASDWDKAGKALTVIEGLRVISGGQVDIIGTVTGINRHKDGPAYRETVVIERDHGRGHHPRYARYQPKRRWVEKHERRCEPEQVWVPHYEWKQRYVPQHVEYRNGEKYIVEGHYVSYRVEEGGHWETRYD